MIKHYVEEEIAEIGVSERITEVPSRDINEIAKCIKLYGPETYKLKIYDVNVEKSYFKGKMLERRSAPFNIEVYKLGTLIEPTEEDKEFGIKYGFIQLKMGVIERLKNQYQKDHILSPDIFQYEYEWENKKKNEDESE